MPKFEDVQRVVAQELDIAPEEITLDSTLTSLGADSLEAAALIVELEDALDTSLVHVGMGTTLREILNDSGSNAS